MNTNNEIEEDVLHPLTAEEQPVESNTKDNFRFVPLAQTPGALGLPPQGSMISPLGGMAVPIIPGTTIPSTGSENAGYREPSYEEIEKDEQETKAMIQSLK